MSKSPSIRVLIVDDEINHADVMAEAVARMSGFSVKQAHNIAEAQRALADSDFDLVITDLRMDSPNDGFTLLEHIRKSFPQIETIVITAHGDVNTAVQAMRSGAYDFIQKPLDLEVIRTQVRRAAEKISLARKNYELSAALDQKFGIHGIIGQSVGM